MIAFASSIGQGRVEDFVGRVVTNCRTHNEPYSFFGVDLGQGRTLLPTCYTFRNRNSTTHVMMNWHLEGSNDKQNWTVLDRRIYLNNTEEVDKLFEEEQARLRVKGGTTTWALDTNVYKELGYEGFRYFRII